MAYTRLFSGYFAWHYTLAVLDFWGVTKNFLWFFFNFFSIPLLFRTLFAPWKHLQEHKKRGFDPADVATVVIVNIIMRLVGAFVRTATITIGLIFLTLTTAFFSVAFVVWIFLPFVIIALTLGGVLFLV